MCTLASTSVEHVPPKCLFPEKKDLPPGIDLRKQLITVSSCDLHNIAKSKDDEYLLYALLMNVPNNQTAKNHVFTKVQRAIARNPSVITQFTNKQVPVLIEDTFSGQVQPTLAIQVDLQRLKGSLEMIGRALYFHHFEVRWLGQVSAHPHFVLAITESDARELNRPLEHMAAAVQELVRSEPSHGQNPEVFAYQIAMGQPPTATIMHLRFYEGSRVTLLFQDVVYPIERASICSSTE
jgi:hypothetical protein